jgi:hypothetical protein
MDVFSILILIVLVCIALGVGICIFAGAVSLFALAADQGFIGVAVYLACWVFLFPFMLGGCAIVGVFAAITE